MEFQRGVSLASVLVDKRKLCNMVKVGHLKVSHRMVFNLLLVITLHFIVTKHPRSFVQSFFELIYVVRSALLFYPEMYFSIVLYVRLARSSAILSITCLILTAGNIEARRLPRHRQPSLLRLQRLL